MYPGTLGTVTSTETWKWTLSSEIQRFAQKHEVRLNHHENAEAIQLLDHMGIVR